MKLNSTKTATIILVVINTLLIVPLPDKRFTTEELIASFFGGLIGLFIAIYLLQRLAIRILNKKEAGEKEDREYLALNYAIVGYWLFRIIVSVLK